VISFRYHIVSIAAAFLALAVGVVLGSTALSDSVLAGLSHERGELAERVSELENENQGLRADLEDSGDVVRAASDDVVDGLLKDRSVVVVTTGRTRESDRDAVTRLIEKSGASVTGRVQLSKKFADPGEGAQLRQLAVRLQPAGVKFPTSGDSGALAGALLGSVLLLDGETAERQSTKDELTAALSGLSEGGFLTHSDDVEPAQLAVVLSGEPVDDDNVSGRASRIASFATQLDGAGAGTVLAGTRQSARGAGVISTIRADTAASEQLSTVDSLKSAAGKLGTVLALREQLEGNSGQYGFAASAKAPMPGMRSTGG